MRNVYERYGIGFSKKWSMVRDGNAELFYPDQHSMFNPH